MRRGRGAAGGDTHGAADRLVSGRIAPHDRVPDGGNGTDTFSGGRPGTPRPDWDDRAGGSAESAGIEPRRGAATGASARRAHCTAIWAKAPERICACLRTVSP